MTGLKRLEVVVQDLVGCSILSIRLRVLEKIRPSSSVLELGSTLLQAAFIVEVEVLPGRRSSTLSFLVAGRANPLRRS